VSWARNNRSVIVNVPPIKRGESESARLEFRAPDPACNPYLAFAALLQAGLEGIEKGYELPAPMERNLYRLTASERREQGIVSLPESLGEAIDELSASDLMRRTLGDHIFPRYVELKRREWDEYRVQVTEWEKEKYLAAL
jgi:glutamine synthetase